MAEGKTLAALAPLLLAHKENQGRAMESIKVRVESNLLPHFGGMALEEIQILYYVLARLKAGARPFEWTGSHGSCILTFRWPAVVQVDDRGLFQEGPHRSRDHDAPPIP